MILEFEWHDTKFVWNEKEQMYLAWTGEFWRYPPENDPTFKVLKREGE